MAALQLLHSVGAYLKPSPCSTAAPLALLGSLRNKVRVVCSISIAKSPIAFSCLPLVRIHLFSEFSWRLHGDCVSRHSLPSDSSQSSWGGCPGTRTLPCCLKSAGILPLLSLPRGLWLFIISLVSEFWFLFPLLASFRESGIFSA